LTGGDGPKTVYFKAGNNAGWADPVSSTIILETLKEVNKVEIRGTVVNEPDTPSLMPLWDASSFGAFYYDLKNNKATETIHIQESLFTLNVTNSRAISKRNYGIIQREFQFSLK